MERFWDWARIVGWCTSTAVLVLTVFWMGLGLVAALENQRNSNREHQAENKRKQEKSAREISYRCALSFGRLEEIRFCISGEIESYRDQNKSSLELDIQQQAANWSIGSFAVSALALAISFYGLLMLRASLQHTREAIRLTREVGHAQVRAYLSISPTIAHLEVDKPTVAAIRITNEGQSPAGEFTYIADIFMRDRETLDDSFPLIAIAEGQPRQAGVIHPKSDMVDEAVSNDVLTKADYDSIKTNGPRQLHIVVHAHYRDVFGQQRLSALCAYTDAAPIEGRPGGFKLGLINTRLGNEAT